jgi:hypothetical protein
MAKKVVSILNKKTVSQKIRQVIEGQTGEWTEQDIKGKVRKAFKPSEEDLKFLYEALLDSAFDSVISSVTGPAKKQNGQVDWIGWDNTVIRLGENRFIRMHDAQLDHLKTRRQHVSDNALKIANSAYEETQRIDEVMREMQEKNLMTAGAALESLGLIEAALSPVGSQPA